MGRGTKVKAKSRGKLTKPATLKPGHDVSRFDCGRDQISNWLHERAKKAQDNGSARIFVICRGTKRVIGFFSLHAGSVIREDAPGKLKRNSPDPIPVIVLGRLGVDKCEQGSRLGSALVAEAMKRSLMASKQIGARALLVHALDVRLVEFYERFGFTRLKPESETLFIPMQTIRDGL